MLPITQKGELKRMSKFIVLKEIPQGKCEYCRIATAQVVVQFVRIQSSKNPNHLYLDNKLETCLTCFNNRF